MMKVFIFSFGTNPHIVAKFQCDRFKTFYEHRAEKIKNEIMPTKPYMLAALADCQAASISPLGKNKIGRVTKPVISGSSP